MLALLEATRDTIAIVMGLPRHSHIARHLKTMLNFEHICGIVEETLLHWPGLLLEAHSNHSYLRLQCQRQLHECRTSMWLLEQNTKGIAVLPKLALDFYVRLWGPRPYTELVAAHLTKFDSSIFNKKWFRHFRINWGIHYAKKPMQSSLPKSDIDRKAFIIIKTNTMLCLRYLCFVTR